MRLFCRTLTVTAATLSIVIATPATAEVHPAGDASDDNWINGVSSDGMTSVGHTTIGTAIIKAFKHIASTYFTLDPYLGHANAVARAANADGSVVVGFSIDNSANNQAAYWTDATATLVDTSNDFFLSEATDVSANGLIIVGWGFDNADFIEDAFYHKSGAITNIFTETNRPASKATGVSADGDIIVGVKTDNFFGPSTMEGFIHSVSKNNTITINAAASVLSFHVDGLAFTQLTGISEDGQVAIGYASFGVNPNDAKAFKYKRASATYEPLGMLDTGTWSIPRAVNSDGSVIVGQAENSNGLPEAFVHRNGTMTGLGFLQGGNTSNATGVSSDGTVIVGYGTIGSGRTHAFVFVNKTMLDETEWMRSLNGPGSLTAMGNNLGTLALEGAHHRPLMSYDAIGKQTQFWATGDFGASSRQTDRRTSYGEVGASQAYGETVVGAAVGTALQRQNLLFGGNARITGQLFLAEVDTRLTDKESIVSLLVMRGQWDARTARGYLTGSGNDFSSGEADMYTTTVRVRYDGPSQKFISNFTAAPYASFALTRTNVDGYAENGGSFPATFNATSHTAQEGRLGLLTKFVAGPATNLRLTAEWIHRFDDASDGLSGMSQTTSGAFAVAGLAPTRDQARVGLDVDHKLSADTLINLSIHAAGFGQAHDVSGSLSLRRAF